MIAVRIAAICAMAALAGAAEPPRERVVQGDGVVPFELEGQAGRMRIDPGGVGWPLLTAEIAARAGLKRGMIGVGFSIGPQRLSGPTAVARLTIDGLPLKHRVGWFVPRYAPGIDGVMGPGALPEPVIRFALRAPQPGERTVALPMVDSGGLFGGFGGLFALIDVGGAPMRVRFDPYHPRTLATAGAGVRLAAAHGGSISGVPVPVEIAFGIARPVRTLTLGRPLTIGPFTIPALGVRSADSGSAAAIPEQGGTLEPNGSDPDEVVVTAKKKRNPDRDRISIGADLLNRCSSIVFDKPAARITLRCG